MEPLPRSWLIMVSLCTILHGHGILAKIMARSWQDLGKASKELAMDFGKGTMASNTGFSLHYIQRQTEPKTFQCIYFSMAFHAI